MAVRLTGPCVSQPHTRRLTSPVPPYLQRRPLGSAGPVAGPSADLSLNDIPWTGCEGHNGHLHVLHHLLSNCHAVHGSHIFLGFLDFFFLAENTLFVYVKFFLNPPRLVSQASVIHEAGTSRIWNCPELYSWITGSVCRRPGKNLLLAWWPCIALIPDFKDIKWRGRWQLFVTSENGKNLKHLKSHYTWTVPLPFPAGFRFFITFLVLIHLPEHNQHKIKCCGRRNWSPNIPQNHCENTGSKQHIRDVAPGRSAPDLPPSDPGSDWARLPRLQSGLLQSCFLDTDLLMQRLYQIKICCCILGRSGRKLFAEWNGRLESFPKSNFLLNETQDWSTEYWTSSLRSFSKI